MIAMDTPGAPGAPIEAATRVMTMIAVSLGSRVTPETWATKITAMAW